MVPWEWQTPAARCRRNAETGGLGGSDGCVSRARRYRERLRPLAPGRRKLSVHIWSHAAAAKAGLLEAAFDSFARVRELKRLWGGVFPAQTALDPVPGRDGW